MLACAAQTAGLEHEKRMLQRSRAAGARSLPDRSSGSGTRVAPRNPEVRLAYSPGLDGLRALAVIAVLLYHADLPFLPGGFLGVEVFFVVSGYLITALLLAEWRKSGRVSLKDFWLRRARRLLPALYVLLVATLAYSVVFLPGEVAGLRADAIAAVGYVTNWFLILEQESYFEAVGRPSVLQHLWSLAVEEQFYLIWPIVLAVGLGVRTTHRRQRVALAVALVGAAASAVAMASLYTPGVDPSRVYYGTDTRATGLLCGAVLAFLWSPAEEPRASDKWAARRGRRRGRMGRRWGPAVPLVLDVVGVAALFVLVLFCLRLGEFEPILYRGGLVAVALATVLLIAVAVHPRSWVVSHVLGSAPLRWLGVRSYGIYLWHWPVFMVTRPELDVPFGGLPLLALRLGVTIVLADLSYRLVERPIRRGALGRAWNALREARGARRRRLRLQWAGAVLPILALCMALGVATALAEPPKPPSYASTKHVRIESGGQAETQKAGATKDDAPGRGAPSSRAGGQPATAAQSGDGRDIRKEPGPRGRVTAIGDSVMLGAVDTLQQDIPRLTTIDARGSRQIPEATRVLKQLSSSGELGSVVIFHIGDNGAITDEEFDEAMDVLSDTKTVLVVNTTVPDGYQYAPNNQVLADGVARYPDRAVLVDWHARSAGHPEYFVDGLHLTPSGARAYADLISSTYRAQER
jgi:peptidoglycan/LPS O-acetylase OafA/YrhL